MAKLQNVFSWSHSAAADFDACRRKRYYGKYAQWGGWERDATPLQKTAYRLNKMGNRYSLQGEAAEMAVMWMLKEHQQGRERSPDEAFDAVARGFLRRNWDESTSRAWAARPKACCLHEHYYPKLHEVTEKGMMLEVAGAVKSCLQHFRDDVLPRIAHVTPDMEIPVSVVGQGDPEHFEVDGVKVYAIPDYVYVEEGRWIIVDWKSGKRKDEHLLQLGVYALWAKTKHGVDPSAMCLRLEYLQSGETLETGVSRADLDAIRARIHGVVQDMAQYLEDADLERNQPLPMEEWDLAYEPSLCRRCAFYELCEKELAEF